MQDGPGYTGHVQDAATGLTYMQQRYYDPQLGGFLSVDPVTAYESPIGAFNRYKYGANNPYRFTDPDGRAELPAWLERIAPPGDFFRVAGEAIGSLAAYGQGVVTGDEGLQQTALDSMREQVKPADGANAAMMIVGPRGAGPSKAGTPYVRPSNATTPAQRASVQGKPCVKCGAETTKQVAGHKTALVKEHHETGSIDKQRMRSTDAVQSECPTCSAREGAEMSRYSRVMNQNMKNP